MSGGFLPTNQQEVIPGAGMHVVCGADGDGAPVPRGGGGVDRGVGEGVGGAGAVYVPVGFGTAGEEGPLVTGGFFPGTCVGTCPCRAGSWFGSFGCRHLPLVNGHGQIEGGGVHVCVVAHPP